MNNLIARMDKSKMDSSDTKISPDNNTPNSNTLDTQNSKSKNNKSVPFEFIDSDAGFNVENDEIPDSLLGLGDDPNYRALESKPRHYFDVSNNNKIENDEEYDISEQEYDYDDYDYKQISMKSDNSPKFKAAIVENSKKLSKSNVGFESIDETFNSEIVDKKSLDSVIDQQSRMNDEIQNDINLQKNKTPIVLMSCLVGSSLFLVLIVYFFVVLRKQKRKSGSAHQRLDDSVNSSHEDEEKSAEKLI